MCVLFLLAYDTLYENMNTRRKALGEGERCSGKNRLGLSDASGRR